MLCTEWISAVLGGPNVSAFVQEYLAYLTRLDPDRSGLVRGATPDEIDRLERAYGQPLPQSYRAFLATFGHSQPGVPPFDEDKHFEVDAVAEYYETYPVPLRDRFVLIAAD